MKNIEDVFSNVYEYYVLKTNRGYFRDAWEEYDDVENFSFTDDIREAYEFVGGLSPSWGNAPKYLWNDKKRESINTLAEAQDYFGGEIISVKKTKVETTKYEFS